MNAKRTNLFKAMLQMSMQWLGFLTNKVETKALEMKEYNEKNINVDVLAEDYERTINIKLDDHHQAMKKLKTEMNLNEIQLSKDEDRMFQTSQQIIKLQDKINTVNEPLDEEEQINLDFSLKNLRLDASILLADIQFNKKFIEQQKATYIDMMKDYHNNRYHGKQLLAEMKQLSHRNTMIDTKQSILKIELGVGDTKYTLRDIARIVEGKEAAFEAEKFTDRVLLRDGAKTEAQVLIEAGEKEQLQTDLDLYLTGVQNGSIKRLN